MSDIDRSPVLYSFASGYLVFLTPFIEGNALSSLCVLGTLAKYYLTAYAWVYFWALYSVPLDYVSVLMPAPNCLDCYSFVTYFEIRKYDASSFVVLLQDCLSYSESVVVPDRL